METNFPVVSRFSFHGYNCRGRKAQEKINQKIFLMILDKKYDTWQRCKKDCSTDVNKVN